MDGMAMDRAVGTIVIGAGGKKSIKITTEFHSASASCWGFLSP
jgi:hypothetical protein